MDRIVTIMSPTRAPILMVYKEGETETIGGVTIDNLTALIGEIASTTDIKTVEMYGLPQFTHHIGEKLVTKYENCGLYIKFHD